MRTLRLYGRPGCHLCEEVADELAPLLAGRARLEHVDIGGDEGLERRYALRIPVLADGDREISGYPLDKASVERWLSEA